MTYLAFSFSFFDISRLFSLSSFFSTWQAISVRLFWENASGYHVHAASLPQGGNAGGGTPPPTAASRDAPMRDAPETPRAPAFTSPIAYCLLPIAYIARSLTAPEIIVFSPLTRAKNVL